MLGGSPRGDSTLIFIEFKDNCLYSKQSQQSQQSNEIN